MWSAYSYLRNKAEESTCTSGSSGSLSTALLLLLHEIWPGYRGDDSRGAHRHYSTAACGPEEILQWDVAEYYSHDYRKVCRLLTLSCTQTYSSTDITHLNVTSLRTYSYIILWGRSLSETEACLILSCSGGALIITAALHHISRWYLYSRCKHTQHQFKNASIQH